MDKNVKTHAQMFYVAKHQNINHVANFSTSYLCVLLLAKCCNRKSYCLCYIVLTLQTWSRLEITQSSYQEGALQTDLSDMDKSKMLLS